VHICTSLYYIVIVESVAFVSYCGVLFPFSLFSRILCSASTLRRPLQCCVHSFGSIQFTYIYFGGGRVPIAAFVPNQRKSHSREESGPFYSDCIPLRPVADVLLLLSLSLSLSSSSIIHSSLCFFYLNNLNEDECLVAILFGSLEIRRFHDTDSSGLQSL
jgi:hypothetical protein